MVSELEVLGLSLDYTVYLLFQLNIFNVRFRLLIKSLSTHVRESVKVY
jgi:hypothetical protein